MRILQTVEKTQKLTTRLRSEGKTIGLIPTMGYLHEGHLSLIRTARKKNNIVIVSIFVNPLQFGPKEDFKKYPRDFKRDEMLCRKEGVDYIFYPDANELYPKGYSTYINVEGITRTLEGKIRPGHFKGVATVVLKLFNIVQPHVAVFGQKDAQQACIIKKMVKELNVNVKLVISPTIREKDGLAMSSRNVYLNPAQRIDAVVLNKSLKLAKKKILAGYKGNVSALRNEMTELIKSRPTVTKVDYISFNNNRTFEEVRNIFRLKKGGGLLISLAVRFDKIRLIDNIILK